MDVIQAIAEEMVEKLTSVLEETSFQPVEITKETKGYMFQTRYATGIIIFDTDCIRASDYREVGCRKFEYANPDLESQLIEYFENLMIPAA